METFAVTLESDRRVPIGHRLLHVGGDVGTMDAPPASGRRGVRESAPVSRVAGGR